MTDILAAGVARVNHWRKYRDPDATPMTIADYQNYYRIHSYATRPDAAARLLNMPPARMVSLDGISHRLPPPYNTPELQIEQEFLDQHEMPGIPGIKAFWRGVRFLGQGAFGMVGLFEWRGGPDELKPKFDKLVVKQLRDDKPPSDSLGNEAEHYTNMNKAKSPHIVRMLHEAQRVVSGADENLGAEWDGKVRRLFLEYCPNGSAWELRARHRAEQTPFSELTLWLLFECMIDAISVLEYGAEFYEDVDGKQTMKPPSEKWNGVVHFDFQIDNIFVAGRDRRHTSTPVFKLGDFGFAEYIDSTDESPDALLFNQSLRGRGTPGYLPPEQFTDRWDYTDWQSSGIAGIFGPWSMIWSAAAIMYQFATLSDTPPSAGTPFFPTFHLNNAPPLGWTYGHDLQAYTFSTTLKDLLFECLYEIPSHRPDLLNIKTRIAAAITATLASDKALINPWDNFIPDDPIDRPSPPLSVDPGATPLPQGGSPSPPPPPAFPAGLAVPMPLLPPPALFPARKVKVTCTMLTREGRQCKISRRMPLPLPGAFDCGRHTN